MAGILRRGGCKTAHPVNGQLMGTRPRAVSVVLGSAAWEKTHGLTGQQKYLALFIKVTIFACYLLFIIYWFINCMYEGTPAWKMFPTVNISKQMMGVRCVQRVEQICLIYLSSHQQRGEKGNRWECILWQNINNLGIWDSYVRWTPWALNFLSP